MNVNLCVCVRVFQLYLDASLNERSELRTFLQYRDNFRVKLTEKLEGKKIVKSVENSDS